jgi:hypothetical protein
MEPELKDEDLLNRFEKEVNVVKTRADDLVKLVKQRGEISFDDAAKALNVTPATVESWANFLEEEKVISIKYNFTTPFLTIFTDKSKKGSYEKKGGKIIKEENTEDEKESETKDEDVDFSEMSPIKKKEVSDIQMLLGEAYSYIKNNEFEKAKEIYAKIEEKYKNLPEEFLRKKEDMNQNLVRLSKDLGLNLSKASKKKMEEKSKEIHKMLGELQGNIRKGDVINATKIYGRIKKTYDELPDGFLEQKLVLQDKIIDLYEELINVREKRDLMDISNKKSEIITMLEEMSQAIREKNTPLAIKMYKRIRELYNTLPSGFLQEKAELQSRILRLYDRLLSDYKTITMNDMERKTEKIEELSREMNEFLEKKEIASARNIYSKMKEVFYSMPEGFLRQKTELQRIMLNLYERLASELDKTSVCDFNSKYNKIENMLKESFDHVKNKRFDLAHELYKEIIETYNSLPPGFLQKKTELRTRILAFYKDISGTESMSQMGIKMPELKESLRDDSDMSLPKTEDIEPSRNQEIKIPPRTINPLKKPEPKILKNPGMKTPPIPPTQRNKDVMAPKQANNFLKEPEPKIMKNPEIEPGDENKIHSSPLKEEDNKSSKELKKSFFKIFKKENNDDIEPPKPP